MIVCIGLLGLMGCNGPATGNSEGQIETIPSYVESTQESITSEENTTIEESSVESSTEITEALESTEVLRSTEEQESTKEESAPDKENEEQSIVTVQNAYSVEKKNDAGNVVLTVRYDMAKTDEEKYPKLAETLNQINRKIQEGSEWAMEEYFREAQERYDQDEVEYEFTYSISVPFANEKITCLILNYYGYNGGAHGFVDSFTYALDSQTGEEISYRDLISDEDGLFAYLLEELERQNVAYGGDFYDNYQETARKMFYQIDAFTQNWWITSNKIIFYYDFYELAPYYVGDQTVEVSVLEHPEFFRSAYWN